MGEVNEESPLLSETNNRLPKGLTAAPKPSRHEEYTATELPASGTAVWTVVPFLLLGVFVANADMTLIIAASQKIASEFDALSDASWLVTSYVLAECASQPLYGKMSDVFGRRGPLIISYIAFAVGCFFCGIGQSFGLVLTGRAVSGAGGAGMTALVSIIIADMVPIREVAAWRSYINIAATLGRSLGGPVGGWLTDSISWRWMFFGQCPLAIAAILLVLWKVPTQTRKGKENEDNRSLGQKMQRIDVLGAILLALAISALLIAMELVAREISWKMILIPTILSVSSAAFFYIVETRWAKEPILPIELITKRATLTSYLIVGFQNSAQCSMLYLIPIYFQIVAGVSVTSAGIRLVPAVIGNASGGLLSGYFISKTGRYKLFTLAASALATLGYSLILIRWRGETSWPEVWYIFFGGFGTGVIVSTTFVHLVASLDASEMAIAGTNSFLAQNLSFVVGLQLATTILHTALRSGLQRDLRGFKHQSKIIEQAVSSVQSIRHMPKSTRAVVVHAYVNSLSYAYMYSVFVSGLGLLVGTTIREGKM